MDIVPRGLDADCVDKGEHFGRVRRPPPAAKAMNDVLLPHLDGGASPSAT